MGGLSRALLCLRGRREALPRIVGEACAVAAVAAARKTYVCLMISLSYVFFCSN